MPVWFMKPQFICRPVMGVTFSGVIAQVALHCERLAQTMLICPESGGVADEPTEKFSIGLGPGGGGVWLWLSPLQELTLPLMLQLSGGQFIGRPLEELRQRAYTSEELPGVKLEEWLTNPQMMLMLSNGFGTTTGCIVQLALHSSWLAQIMLITPERGGFAFGLTEKFNVGVGPYGGGVWLWLSEDCGTVVLQLSGGQFIGRPLEALVQLANTREDWLG